MKIYVAGASKEIDLVEFYINKLRNFGHITWCANIRKVGDANPRDLPREENAKFAEEDLLGVKQCHLSPESPISPYYPVTRMRIRPNSTTTLSLESAGLTPHR